MMCLQPNIENAHYKSKVNFAFFVIFFAGVQTERDWNMPTPSWIKL